MVWAAASALVSVEVWDAKSAEASDEQSVKVLVLRWETALESESDALILSATAWAAA